MATLGSVTVNLPLNYKSTPIKQENISRALDGTLLVNYTVTTGDVAVTKYSFELSGITKSERMAVRTESLKTGNLAFVDDIQIPEVFSTTAGSGTNVISLQRGLGSTQGTTGYISVEYNGVAQSVTISTATNPSTGQVFVDIDGNMIFGTVTASTNGIIVNYIPAYAVHVTLDEQEFIAKDPNANKISRYRITMEEV